MIQGNFRRLFSALYDEFSISIEYRHEKRGCLNIRYSSLQIDTIPFVVQDS
jgi:hypothetical protein